MTRSIGKLISAAFDLALAGVFLITWLDPGNDLARSVDVLLLMMLIEFITVHSSAMLGSVWMGPGDRQKRLRGVIGLIGMYALFVGGFSIGFSTWAPFVGFWLLTGNRLMGMFMGGRPDEATREDAERSWARSVVLYLAGAFLTTFMPIPRLGLTSDVMAAIDIPGSGLWVDEPWRVMAFGAVYFGAGGVLMVRDVVRGRETVSAGQPEPTEVSRVDSQPE